MRKVILAFDSAQFSEGAFEFARRMNEKQPIILTGVFLPQADYANLWSYSNAPGNPLFIPLVEEDDTEAVQKNIDHFEQLCRDNNIGFKTHKDFFNFALPELKKETRYADLLILGSETFYKNLEAGEPNQYLKDALHAAECPVLVVPEKFDFPEKNLLAYDGSESSVYAIKHFAYLFPEFSGNKTLLVTADRDVVNIPVDEQYIKELATAHFPDCSLLMMETTSRAHFLNWIKEKSSTILVTGSFGRSFLSQLFKKSFVSDVIRDHKLPVFITHR